MGTVCWPGDADLAPELLYSESWLADDAAYSREYGWPDDPVTHLGDGT